MTSPSLVDKTMAPQSPFLEDEDQPIEVVIGPEDGEDVFEDRKSTRLNSSHRT